MKNLFYDELIFFLKMLIFILLFILFQLEHAMQNKKTLFENVNIDWGLLQEDGSTDFSDEDGDEKVRL